ncbi:unnamed protein product [Caenorhabditis bovis]|uniref:Uncharacterized protein n=1 Tax=Caenorhabditis bovis TaxID=2654633 RepID=A0A8S1FDH7_9PELO|nr:unnamed protein product [Caenorhabditis bovis]
MKPLDSSSQTTLVQTQRLNRSHLFHSTIDCRLLDAFRLLSFLYEFDNLGNVLEWNVRADLHILNGALNPADQLVERDFKESDVFGLNTIAIWRMSRWFAISVNRGETQSSYLLDLLAANMETLAASQP